MCVVSITSKKHKRASCRPCAGSVITGKNKRLRNGCQTYAALPSLWVRFINANRQVNCCNSSLATSKQKTSVELNPITRNSV